MTERILASPETLLEYLRRDNEIRLTAKHESRIRSLHSLNRAALERALLRFDNAGLRRPLSSTAALRRAGSFLRDVEEGLSGNSGASVVAAAAAPSQGSSPKSSLSSSSAQEPAPGFQPLPRDPGPEQSEGVELGDDARQITSPQIVPSPFKDRKSREGSPTFTEFEDLSLDSKLLDIDIDIGQDRKIGEKNDMRRVHSPEAAPNVNGIFKNLNNGSPEKRPRVDTDAMDLSSPTKFARQAHSQATMKQKSSRQDIADMDTVPGNVNVIGLRKGMELLHGLLYKSSYKPICFGMRYYLSMLVSRNLLSWSSIHIPSLHEFRGLSNGEAGKKVKTSPFNLVPMDSIAFEELDKDEEALRARGNCVDPTSSWCGGRVFFSGTLGPDPACPDDFVVKLDPPRCAHSTRFSRRFGSARFLRIRLHHTAMITSNRNSLKVFLTRDLFLAGKRYRPLLQRDDTLFFFAIDVDMPTITSFLDWHGPLAANGSQKLLKYLQRLVLGFSSSIAGPTLQPECVSYERDCLSQTGQIMTDGAAAVSEETLRDVTKAAGWQRAPAAFQARFAGAKGMWYVEPQSEPGSRLSIRDSQLKLKRSEPGLDDVTLNTIDILTPAQVQWPSTLSKQIVLVLAHNGVDEITLVALQTESLRQVTDQLSFDRPCFELARALDKFGNITNNRNNRNLLDARAKGLKSRTEDERDRDGKDDEDGELFTAPKSKLEKCYEMLLAGFHPRESAFLADQMVDATKDILQRALNKFQIKVPRSAEVIVIPDPIGVLQEGEVQLTFNSSKMPRDPDTGFDISALNGDVLVTRHPCLTPGDCRKVRATTYKALERYSGVIVFSTKGDRSLADVLSGGDMDGDTIRVIWEPKIVNNFQNADLDRCIPSISIEDAFHKDERTVDSFLKTCPDGEDRDLALVQIVTHNAFAIDLVGIYGNLTLCSAYKNGVGHQDTLDLAFKFNQTMDGVKNGVYIREEVLKADQMRYNEKLPSWESQSAESTANVIKRDPSLPPCILDVLWVEGSREASQIVRERGLEVLRADDDDSDLAALWSESIAKGRLSLTQQQAIQSHVDNVLQAYTSLWTNHFKEAPSSPQKSKFTSSPTKRRATSSKDTTEEQFETTDSREVAAAVLRLFDSWQSSKLGYEICGIDVVKINRTSPFLLTPPSSSHGSEPSSSAFSSSSSRDGAGSFKIEARLTTPELRYYKQVVASCLYATAVDMTKGDKSRRLKRVKLAFEVAWRDLIDCKVAKRPSVTMTHNTYQSLRLMRQAADL